MKINKTLVLSIAVLFLCLMLSGIAVAAVNFTVTDVYYQKYGSTDIVRIDYTAALAGKDAGSAFFGGDDGALYDATVEAVRETLGNFGKVWVGVFVEGVATPVYIDHGAALMAGYELADSVYATGEAFYSFDEPDYTHELIIVGGQAVEKPIGELGLLGQYYLVWDALGQQWLAYVDLNVDDLDGYAAGNIARVLIFDQEAKAVPGQGNLKWQLQIAKGSNFWDDDPLLTAADIVVVMDDNREFQFD